MYLFHNTKLDSLKSILSSNYLKSYSMLKKENILIEQGEGYDIYDENKFVYFSCTDELFDKQIYSEVTLYFGSNLLNNRIFYTSGDHTPFPNILNPKNKFSKKYNSSTKIENVPIILEKLYRNSISKLPNGKAFQVFQQIAINNKANNGLFKK
jgi:hypothetical protein